MTVEGHVNLQGEIERIFGRDCFTRPVYYNYPGGLRFELSESGGVIEQFITALRKAMEVCSDVFRDEQALVVCLRGHSKVITETSRQVLRALGDAGITVARERSLWRDPIAPDDGWDEHTPEYWVTLAFEVPTSHLQALLWCALASDFPITPNPSCLLYLFNLPQQLMVWPYDDRGMDVVGPNHARLEQLYHQYNRYLLDHDRQTMDAVFAGPGLS
ncbi:DUF3885 domain-containing protein [Pseudomonas entomophila]|uniref:DUF3885 domain-containing protein n=1 Tax=Pseudomonas entomophila TaxID=312306 RepID=UPI002404BAF2|nr:DUF3885 domain-containing protein [Pseudomonas entomophila]MDF9620243.1 DUF3885 domain-containing protein [Pseudomonas entomophila]